MHALAEAGEVALQNRMLHCGRLELARQRLAHLLHKQGAQLDVERHHLFAQLDEQGEWASGRARARTILSGLELSRQHAFAFHASTGRTRDTEA